MLKEQHRPGQLVRQTKAGLNTALMISALLLLSACGALESDLEANNNPCISSPATTTQVELICLSAETLENSEQMAKVRAAYQNNSAVVGLVNSSKEELFSILSDAPPSAESNETLEIVNNLQTKSERGLVNLVVTGIRQNKSTVVLTYEFNTVDRTMLNSEIAGAQQQINELREELYGRRYFTTNSAWRSVQETSRSVDGSAQKIIFKNKIYEFLGYDSRYDHYLIETNAERQAKQIWCKGSLGSDNDFGWYPWTTYLSIRSNSKDTTILTTSASSQNYGPVKGAPQNQTFYAGKSLNSYSNGLESNFQSNPRISDDKGVTPTLLRSDGSLNSNTDEVIKWTHSPYPEYMRDSDKCTWKKQEQYPYLTILSLPKGKKSSITIVFNSEARRTQTPKYSSKRYHSRTTYGLAETITLAPNILSITNPIRLQASLDGANGTIPQYEKVVSRLSSKSNSSVNSSVTRLAWEIRGIPDWLSVTPAQGSGDADITFQTRSSPPADAVRNGVKLQLFQKSSQNKPIDIEVFPEEPPLTFKAANERGEIDTATLSYFSPVNINIQYYVPNEKSDQRSRWYITDLPWWAEVSGSSLSNFSAQCLMAPDLVAKRGYPGCSDDGSQYVNTTFTLQRRTVVDSSGKGYPKDYYDQNIDSCGLITLTSDTQDPVLAPGGTFWQRTLTLCWE